MMPSERVAPTKRRGFAAAIPQPPSRALPTWRQRCRRNGLHQRIAELWLWLWLRLLSARSSSLPRPLLRHFAGQPRHVDIPRRIAAGQLHATAGGGAVVEEHDRAETRLRLHLARAGERDLRSEEHTSELQSLMRISYAVLCLKKKT